MTDLVVVGLGYVGLPLVAEGCRAGLSVVGLDITPSLVDDLNAGISHVDDLSDDEISDLLGRGFRATTDASVVARHGPLCCACPPRCAPTADPTWSPSRAPATPSLPTSRRAAWSSWSRRPTPAPPRRSSSRSSRRGPGMTGRLRLPRWPTPPSASTRATSRSACATPPRSSAGPPGCDELPCAVLRPGRRHGRAARGTREAEIGEAAGEHLPPRQHRAGQRDGAVLPRARHRPLGRRSTWPAPSRSASRPSTRARASAATASRSTPTTSATGFAPSSATPSASSSWRRRSTPPCPRTWRRVRARTC